MSIIPLDLQRRCEQRWAARFARQAPEPSFQKSEHEKQDQQFGALAKANGFGSGETIFISRETVAKQSRPNLPIDKE